MGWQLRNFGGYLAAVAEASDRAAADLRSFLLAIQIAHASAKQIAAVIREAQQL